MWLTSSSVGRKLVMAITGCCLVLFVTFHCLMNAVAIVWPTAYNSICEFLGANWYALVASAGLALLCLVHIFYAVWLTLQNRKARGNDRYAVVQKPASVEWSSQNMLVLGFVILAFFVVHLVQFWAKMQLVEVIGAKSTLPPSIGTLFIQEAFKLWWTPVVYIIGFIALWFHINHGFWSMFQSAGWNNTTWMPRLKTIGTCWSSIVVLLFTLQAVVFSVKAQNDFYKNDPELLDQYKEYIGEIVGIPGENFSFSQIPSEKDLQEAQNQIQMFESNPEMKQQYGASDEMIENQKKVIEKWLQVTDFVNYLKGTPKTVSIDPEQVGFDEPQN